MPILSDGTVVRIKRPEKNASKLVVVRGPKGDPGLAGVSGNFGFERQFTVPAATWIIPVPPEFGRTPAVTVLVDGRVAITDVVADSTTVTVIHPEPTVGSAILT